MNGIICIYKEAGYTSFDVVAIMRRICGTKKVGHGGTLDPMAEGVLPIFVGNATKAVDFCPDEGKEYRAEMQFGITTDTQDITGTVTDTCSTPVSRNMEYMLASKFLGEQLQTPPMYSAVQVNGQRLYDLARQGIEVERTPRKITVHSIKFERFENNEATALISCSKGTYIRTLIHDMGQLAGTGAVMTSLVRTRSGIFTERDCYKLDEIERIRNEQGEAGIEKLMMSVDMLFAGLPKAWLDERQTRMFKNGIVLDAARIKLDKVYTGSYAVLDCFGALLALASIGTDGDLVVAQRFRQDAEESAEKPAAPAPKPEQPPETPSTSRVYGIGDDADNSEKAREIPLEMPQRVKRRDIDELKNVRF